MLWISPLLAAGGLLLEPLYWQASEDGLAYVIKKDSSTEVPLAGKAISPHFEWDFGFQVGGYVTLPHDAWEIGLQLKHIHTNANSHSQGHLIPLWMQAPIEVAHAQAHWRVHLGLLDGGLSNFWQATPSLQITWSGGIRSAWVRQKYQISYSGASSLSMKNKFWGIGPMVHVATEWMVGPYGSLVGQGTCALLCGQFYLHQAEWSIKTSQDYFRLHDQFFLGVPSVDVSIAWRWQFGNAHARRWFIEIAWDQVLLWGQAQWGRMTSGGWLKTGGALTLQGWRAGIHCPF